MTEESKKLDTQELRKLLEFLINHNEHHIEDLNEWVGRIQQAGRDDVAEKLYEIVTLSRDIERHFKAAAELL